MSANAARTPEELQEDLLRLRQIREAQARRADLTPDAILAVFVVAFFVYLSTIGFDFVYDDVRTLPRVANQSRAGWAYALTEWTFDLQAGMTPGAYHWANAGLHLINGMLLLWLCRALAPTVALVAVAIFLLHPIQVDTVAYVTARADLLVALGFLLACAGLEQRHWLREAVLVAGGSVVMLAAKPSGAFALIPLAGVMWYGRPASPLWASPRWAGWLAFAVVGFVGALLASWQNGVRFAETGWSPQSWAALQLLGIWAWLVTVAVPVGLTHDPGTLGLGPTWVVEVAVGLLVAALVGLRTTRLRVLAAWVLAAVGWRLVIPHTEVFGGPGDGYLLMTGVSVWVAVAIDQVWKGAR